MSNEQKYSKEKSGSTNSFTSVASQPDPGFNLLPGQVPETQNSLPTLTRQEYQRGVANVMQGNGSEAEKKQVIRNAEFYNNQPLSLAAQRGETPDDQSTRKEGGWCGKASKKAISCSIL